MHSPGLFSWAAHVSFEREIGRAVLLAVQLLRQMTLGEPDGIKPVVSVDELKDVVAARRQCTIEASEVAFEAVHVRGRLERWEGNRAVIHIRQAQDTYWKRFVAAKEYMHLIVDQEDDFNPYGDETLDELVKQGHFGQASFSEVGGDPAQSEIIAEVAALEVLYPLRFRPADVEALSNKQTTVIRLAHTYGIPPSYVATALHQDYLTKVMEGSNAVETEVVDNPEKYTL